MAELLSDDEMFELTQAKQAKAQIKVLQDNNIYHIVRKDGTPVTTWYNVNHPTHLRGMPEVDEGFNFSAIE